MTVPNIGGWARDKRALLVSPLAAALMLLGCGRAMDGTDLIAPRAEADVRAVTGVFEIGCPDGWEIRHQWNPQLTEDFQPRSWSSYSMDLQPAAFEKANPIGVSATIAPFGAGVEDAREFMQILTERRDAVTTRVETGAWEGRLAAWADGRSEVLGTRLTSRVYAILGPDGWLLFSFFAEEGFEEELREVLDGFQPLSDRLLSDPPDGFIDWEPCP